MMLAEARDFIVIFFITLTELTLTPAFVYDSRRDFYFSRVAVAFVGKFAENKPIKYENSDISHNAHSCAGGSSGADNMEL